MARSTMPLPMIGNGLAVDEIMISALIKASGMSSSNTASAPNSLATCCARAKVRLATMSLRTPAWNKWRATNSMVSPAPTSSAVLSFISEKICCAIRTAAKATDTGFSPIEVSVRTRFAIEKV